MNILFLGDLVGNFNFLYLKKNLKNIVSKYNIDFVILNGENAADGYGITPAICNDLFSLGINVITSGNHIWDQKEIIPYIAKNNKLLRPYNFDSDKPGIGYVIYPASNGRKILVANFICTVFMKNENNPFKAANNLLEKFKLKKNCHAIIVDLHGEAASEKQSFANHFDGKVSAVFGTHTHVPTSDLRILDKGTAYLTDAGMCGDYDSVIGGEKEQWTEKFLKDSAYRKIDTASIKATICGVIIKIDKNTGLAIATEQIIIGDTLKNKVPNETIFK